MSYNESLRASSNYPAMTQSQWDSAPFNEPVIPEQTFRCEVVEALKKVVTIQTDDYTPEYDDGQMCCNTENTDFCEEYKSTHATILNLLEELERYIIEDLETCQSSRKKYLESLLEDCRGWKQESIEVDEL